MWADNVEVEQTAVGHRRVEPDAATQQTHQLLADGQPKTAGLAREGGVALREGLKQAVDLTPGNDTYVFMNVFQVYFYVSNVPLFVILLVIYLYK
jgi:hypothetical protein